VPATLESKKKDYDEIKERERGREGGREMERERERGV
jgi:hypothetical protein